MGAPNDSRRRDARREACEELAEALAGDAGLRTARLLQMAGGDRAVAADPPPADTAPPCGPRRISIWEPRTEDGELVFVRPEPWSLGEHHAARRVLLAAKEATTRRLCFFGESAAAGYLYAPHFTPAELLGRQLARFGSWEVVDLARTNETLAGLVATVEASLQLDPDVLVIFAGNNWDLLETPEVSPYAPSVVARQRYALALSDGGPAAAAALARRRLRRRATAALAAVARLAGRRRVVLVVPERNLADWEAFQPPTWLPGDATARWWETYRLGEAALGAGRFDEAERAAMALVELDGGLGGASHGLLRRVAAARGREKEVRRAAEAEVDGGVYAVQALLGVPRAGSEALRLLRAAAREHGFTAVELPRIFAEHTGSALPGRRLFLDYCHLTSEGIRLAMAAVAEAVLKHPDGAGPSWREVLATSAGDVPPPEVEALARLGAAVHGAHRLVAPGRKASYVEPWLRDAVDTSPEIASALYEIVAARSAPVPAVLTTAQVRNFASPYRLTLLHGWRWDGLDADLLEAVGRVLGEEGGEQVDRLLVESLGLGADGAELSRAPYLWDPLERFYPEAMGFDERGTLRAVLPETSFALVHDAQSEVTLELVARLPAIRDYWRGRSGEVEVRLNGQVIEDVPLDEAWSHLRLHLPCEKLRRGLNRLTLLWPPLPPAGEIALDAAVRRLELGLDAELHPVFGEVASLFARNAGAASCRDDDGRPSRP